MMRITSTISKIVIHWEQNQLAASPISLAALKSSLSTVKEIQSIKLDGAKTNCIEIVYRSPKGVVEFLRQVTQAIRTADINLDQIRKDVLEFQPKGPEQQQTLSVRAFTTVTRLFYGGLACGSFVMAWIGLIVPGIPTVPFVILTVYFAEKVSPTFHNLLMDAPVIGTAMRDWSEHRAIRRSVRDTVFIFMGVMVAVAVLMTPIDSVTFIFVVFFAALSFWITWQLPVIDDHPAENSADLRVA